MLKSLFPWKHNKTKHGKQTKEVMAEQQTTMNDELILQSQNLYPCHVCGRTFLPLPLKKHQKICEKTAVKKRKPFDSLRQRVEGTELADFHQKTYLKRPEPEVVQPKKENQKSWKEKHLEFVSAIRAAKGMPSSPEQPTTATLKTRSPKPKSTSLTAANERCPSCDRQFGPKAFDRHVEWCKERQARIQHSPASVQVAKERLEARIKYRVPPVKSKKTLVREKYSSNGNFSDTASVKSSHTPQLSRTPSIRKPKSLMHVGKVSNANEDNKRDKEDNKKAKEDNTRVKIERCGDGIGINKVERERERVTPVIGSPIPKLESNKSLPPKKEVPIKSKLNNLEINDLVQGITVNSLKFCQASKKMVTWKDTVEERSSKQSTIKAKIERKPCIVKKVSLDVPDTIKSLSSISINQSKSDTNEQKRVPRKARELEKILSSEDVFHKVKCTTNLPVIKPNFNKINKVLEKYKLSSESSENAFTEKLVKSRNTVSKVGCSGEDIEQQRVVNDLEERDFEDSNVQKSFKEEIDSENTDDDLCEKELEKYIFPKRISHNDNRDIKSKNGKTELEDEFNTYKSLKNKIGGSTLLSQEDILQPLKSGFRGRIQSGSKDNSIKKDCVKRRIDDVVSFLKQDERFEDDILLPLQVGVVKSSEKVSELRNINRFITSGNVTKEGPSEEALSTQKAKPCLTPILKNTNEIESGRKNSEEASLLIKDEADCLEDILKPWKFDVKGNSERALELEEFKKVVLNEKLIEDTSLLENEINEDTSLLENEMSYDNVIKPWKFDIKGASNEVVNWRNAAKPAKTLMESPSILKTPSPEMLKPLNSPLKNVGGVSLKCLKPVLRNPSRYDRSELGDIEQYVLEKRNNNENEALLAQAKKYEDDVLQPLKFTLDADQSHKDLTDWFDQFVKDIHAKDEEFDEDINDVPRREHDSNSTVKFSECPTAENDTQTFSLNSKSADSLQAKDFQGISRDEDINVAPSKFSTVDNNTQTFSIDSNSSVSFQITDIEDGIASNEKHDYEALDSGIGSSNVLKGSICRTTNVDSSEFLQEEYINENANEYTTKSPEKNGSGDKGISANITAQYCAIENDKHCLDRIIGNHSLSASLEDTVFQSFMQGVPSNTYTRNDFIACSDSISTEGFVFRANLDEKCAKEQRNQRMRSAGTSEILEPSSLFTDSPVEDFLPKSTTCKTTINVDFHVGSPFSDLSLPEKGYEDLVYKEKEYSVVKDNEKTIYKNVRIIDSEDLTEKDVFGHEYDIVVDEIVNEQKADDAKLLENCEFISATGLEEGSPCTIVEKREPRDTICLKIDKNISVNSLDINFESAYITEASESDKTQKYICSNIGEKYALNDTFDDCLYNRSVVGTKIQKKRSREDSYVVIRDTISQDNPTQEEMVDYGSGSVETKNLEGPLLKKDSSEYFQDAEPVFKLNDTKSSKSANEKIIYLFQSVTEFNLTPGNSINNLAEQNSSWSSINTEKICSRISGTTFEESVSQYGSSRSRTFDARSISIHCNVKKSFSSSSVGTALYSKSSRQGHNSFENVSVGNSSSLPNMNLKVEDNERLKTDVTAFDKNNILEIATKEFVKKCKCFEFKAALNDEEYAVPKKKRRVSSSSSEDTNCEDLKNAMEAWKKVVHCYNNNSKLKNNAKDRKLQDDVYCSKKYTCHLNANYINKDQQNLFVRRPTTAASSLSLSEYTPRTVGVLEKVFFDKKSACGKDSKEDMVILSVSQCKKLLAIDKSKLPKLEKHFEKRDKHSKEDVLKLPVIGSEQRIVKTSCSKKKDESNIRLPKIGGGVESMQKVNVGEENGVIKSTPSPTAAYDPFESAQRQFMELLECDDFKPFTASSPRLTPLAPRRPHTTPLTPLQTTPKSPITIKKSVKSADISIHSNHTKKRASVIDPPSNFKDFPNSLEDPLMSIIKDSTSNFRDPLNNLKDSLDSVVDDFELMESMINNDIDRENNEIKLGNSGDSSFYLHHLNVKNQKESLTLGLDHNVVNRKYSDDMSSIDPSLINENDNLSLPDHFKTDDYSPTSTVDTDVTIQNSTDNVDVDHYSVQYDAKIAAIEPEVQKKPLLKRSVSLVSKSKKETTTLHINNVNNNSKGKKQSSSPKVTSKSVSSFGKGNQSSKVEGEHQVVNKKKSLPSLKRSMTLFDPIPKPPAMKNKEDVHNYFSEQDQKMASSMEERKSPVKDDVIPLEDTLKAEDLFAVDDEMYEEYKKYEEMYLKEKELQQHNSTEKKKQKTKSIDMNYGLLTASEEEEPSSNVQNSKISNDSAYGSLTRKTSKHRTRTPKLAPLEPKHIESTSSSGSENCPTSPSPFDTRLSMSKFCHECGTKFPVTSAKFCVECGVKRLVL